MECNRTLKAFEGKDFFLGIDVSKKKWPTAIRDEEMLLKYQSMEPDPEKLYNYMDRNYPGGRYHVVYEAGFCGFWVQRGLERAGFKAIVVHAADVPTTDKERDRKTDAVDARKLAETLSDGKLKAIYVPSEEAERIRAMARMGRKTCSKEQTRWKNRISSHLDYYGVETPRHSPSWPKWYIQWLSDLELDNGPFQETLRFMLEEYSEFKARTHQFKKRIEEECKRYFGKDLFEYICSLPGIGKETTVTLLTELINIERFESFDKIDSYAGLVPSCHDTGEKTKTQGLTNRRNRYLRYILIESSWVAIRKDPELYAAYSRYRIRMKPQEAIIRIAKKLLKRIYCVWKERRPYEYRSPSRN